MPHADNTDHFAGAFQGEIHHSFRQGLGRLYAMLPLLVIVDQHSLAGFVNLSGGAFVDGVTGAEHGAGWAGGDHPDSFGPALVEQEDAAGRRAGNLGRLVDDGLQQIHHIAAVHDLQRSFMQKRQQFVSALYLQRRVFLVVYLVKQQGKDAHNGKGEHKRV